MRTKTTLLAASIIVLALVVAGCGSSGSKSSTTSTKLSSNPIVKAKQQQVQRAQLDLAHHPGDPNRMAALAESYIALGSPDSGDKHAPADAEQSYQQALKYLEQAHTLKPGDDSITQTLIDTYMHESKYDKAESLLQGLAAKKNALPNVFFQLALAAQNTQDYSVAINALNTFIAKTPKNDPRVKIAKSFITGDKAAEKAKSQQAASAAGPGKTQTTSTTAGVKVTSTTKK